MMNVGAIQIPSQTQENPCSSVFIRGFSTAWRQSPTRAAAPKCRVMPQSLEWAVLLGYFNETK
jgi:hypothetical protein